MIRLVQTLNTNAPLNIQNFLPNYRSNRAARRNYVAVGNAANYVITHANYVKSEIMKP